jgi:hypothetical protein
MRREAHRTPDHQIQVVEARVVPSDLGEEDAMLVEDAQDAAVDVDMAAVSSSWPMLRMLAFSRGI